MRTHSPIRGAATGERATHLGLGEGESTRYPRRVRGLFVVMLSSALLAFTASALAAKSHNNPVKGATYRGTTSEQLPVTFKVAKNGKRIQGLTTRLGYDGNCGQGGGPSYEIKVSSITIRAGGKFLATTRGTLSGTPIPVKPITVKVSGRISGRSASGKVFQPRNICAAPNKGKLAYSETFTAAAV